MHVEQSVARLSVVPVAEMLVERVRGKPPHRNSRRRAAPHCVAIRLLEQSLAANDPFAGAEAQSGVDASAQCIHKDELDSDPKVRESLVVASVHVYLTVFWTQETLARLVAESEKLEEQLREAEVTNKENQLIRNAQGGKHIFAIVHKLTSSSPHTTGAAQIQHPELLKLSQQLAEVSNSL